MSFVHAAACTLDNSSSLLNHIALFGPWLFPYEFVRFLHSLWTQVFFFNQWWSLQTWVAIYILPFNFLFWKASFERPNFWCANSLSLSFVDGAFAAIPKKSLPKQGFSSVSFLELTYFTSLFEEQRHRASPSAPDTRYWMPGQTEAPPQRHLLTVCSHPQSPCFTWETCVRRHDKYISVIFKAISSKKPQKQVHRGHLL